MPRHHHRASVLLSLCLCYACLLPRALSCTQSLRNGLFTNTCGCAFSWYALPASDASLSCVGFNTDSKVAGLDDSLKLEEGEYTVRNWADGDLANGPRCYSTTTFQALGGSTAQWPGVRALCLSVFLCAPTPTLRLISLLPLSASVPVHVLVLRVEY